MSANIAYLQDSQALDHLQDLFDAQRRAYAANPMPPAAGASSGSRLCVMCSATNARR